MDLVPDLRLSRSCGAAGHPEGDTALTLGSRAIGTLIWHPSYMDGAGDQVMDASRAACLRGEMVRTKQLEQIEEAYFHAVAAASGCSVFSTDYDDGIDALLKHRSKDHRIGRDAFLQVQLKCTAQFVPGLNGSNISRPFRNDRFELFAETNPSIHKIVVIMVVPKEPAEWVSCTPDAMTLKHCAYWTNIAGKLPSGEHETLVSAPRDQIFDDLALCNIMTRVGQGGRP